MQSKYSSIDVNTSGEMSPSSEVVRPVTYGAIKLRDVGKSVMVVEKTGTLGGHENIYVDPSTGSPIDYGVQTYRNIAVVTEFLRSV